MRNEAALTKNPICDSRSRMGRKMRYPDKIIAPLPAGWIKRIEAVLTEEEDKTDLLREAVERELKRREEDPSRKPSPPSSDR